MIADGTYYALWWHLERAIKRSSRLLQSVGIVSIANVMLCGLFLQGKEARESQLMVKSQVANLCQTQTICPSRNRLIPRCLIPHASRQPIFVLLVALQLVKTHCSTPKIILVREWSIYTIQAAG